MHVVWFKTQAGGPTHRGNAYRDRRDADVTARWLVDSGEAVAAWVDEPDAMRTLCERITGVRHG